MARPKLGESETERLHLKIAADEIEKIDNWRYASKIPSRSEAVRRLCQIGLMLGSQLETITDNMVELSEAMVSLDEQMFDVWSTIAGPFYKGDTLNREAVGKVVEGLLSNVSQVEEGVDHVSTVLMTLSIAVAGIVRSDAVTGKKITSEAFTKLHAQLEKTQKLRAEIRESRKQMSEYGYRSEVKGEDKGK